MTTQTIDYETLKAGIEHGQRRFPTDRVQQLPSGNYLFRNVPDYDADENIIIRPWVEVTGTPISENWHINRTLAEHEAYFQNPLPEHKGMRVPSMPLLCSLITIAYTEYVLASDRTPLDPSKPAERETALFDPDMPAEYSNEKQFLKSDAQLYLEMIKQHLRDYVFLTSTRITYDANSLDAIVQHGSAQPHVHRAPMLIDKEAHASAWEGFHVLAPRPIARVGKILNLKLYDGNDLYTAVFGPTYHLNLLHALLIVVPRVEEFNCGAGAWLPDKKGITERPERGVGFASVASDMDLFLALSNEKGIVFGIREASTIPDQ